MYCYVQQTEAVANLWGGRGAAAPASRAAVRVWPYDPRNVTSHNNNWIPRWGECKFATEQRCTQSERCNCSYSVHMREQLEYYCETSLTNFELSLWVTWTWKISWRIWKLKQLRDLIVLGTLIWISFVNFPSPTVKTVAREALLRIVGSQWLILWGRGALYISQVSRDCENQRYNASDFGRIRSVTKFLSSGGARDFTKYTATFSGIICEVAADVFWSMTALEPQLYLVIYYSVIPAKQFEKISYFSTLDLPQCFREKLRNKLAFAHEVPSGFSYTLISTSAPQFCAVTATNPSQVRIDPSKIL